MLAAITPLPGHAVLLLLVQLALLIGVARLGAELVRRVGLPAVVGELAAGIMLGPTVFGHYLPGAFATVFPQDAAQFHLLEVVGTLGMVLLLLLTGLETDLRLLRNLGRAALVASASGMVLPFMMGFGLGLVMPEGYLAQPDRRLLFSAFLATAMAISAMPVIAKILMDLDLTKRNLGLVIISAGVVDDTAGWLILSVIAGAAAQGGAVELAGIGRTLVWIALFLAAMAWIGHPLLKLCFRAISRFRSRDADLVAMVVVTLLCAAATERIGVHAVFGAFIAGGVLRQLPQLDEGTVHRLESFVFAVLAPVFFGIVGLRVDLWSLGQAGGVTMLGIVLGVACLGKLVGCTAGGLLGGMRFWEAFSIAIAMNARGAMGLVVAIVGLSLGILNQQMFSIIVVVAIVTSFMAPLGLRLSMRFVRMTEDEAKRIEAREAKSAFDPERIRLLVPTAAGPNAIEAARLALGIARRSQNAVEVLYVDAASSWRERLRRLMRGPRSGRGLDQHLATIRKLAQGVPEPRVRTVAGDSISASILAEAAKGFNAILIGASQVGMSLGGKVLEEVVTHAPCHVAIVRAGASDGVRGPYRHLLVPVDGSLISRVAAEFAMRYCETTDAALTVVVPVERWRFVENLAEEDDPGSDALPGDVASAFGPHSPVRSSPDDNPGSPSHPADGRLSSTPMGIAVLEQTPEQELERICPLFRFSPVKPTLLHLDYDPTRSAVLDELQSGKYDLLVLGAENRSIRHRMFFGYNNERLIRRSTVSLAVVVPNLARLR
jgi:Kef-type K+ transport system membrane component KefB/nucleotide-binding universal stress UspA family protein